MIIYARDENKTGSEWTLPSKLYVYNINVRLSSIFLDTLVISQFALEKLSPMGYCATFVQHRASLQVHQQEGKLESGIQADAP